MVVENSVFHGYGRAQNRLVHLLMVFESSIFHICVLRV